VALSSSASAEIAAHNNRVLAANGIGGIHFGISETAAIKRVTKLIGTAPLHPKPTRDSACNLDASIGWHDLMIDFDHRKFVGYSYFGKRFATAAGFRVGDRLSTARRLYGNRLIWSAENGGSWEVRTSGSLLGGYAWKWNAPRIGPRAIANSIDAGAVGCPAMSPLGV
jgi:hypothetical protein